MEFLLASANAHKATELNELFSGTALSVRPSPEKIEVVEDSGTFEGNALLKAKAYFEKFGQPTISDDSGLVVESLPGELGVESAYFGGESLTDRERCELLLKKLGGKENRKAYFVCILCAYKNEKEVYFFEGRVKGNIADQILGDQGFGYDPVFIPESAEAKGQSFAQNPDFKNLNSHRFLAAQKLLSYFS